MKILIILMVHYLFANGIFYGSMIAITSHVGTTIMHTESSEPLTAIVVHAGYNIDMIEYIYNLIAHIREQKAQG